MTWIPYRWQSDYEHRTGQPMPQPSADTARILDRMEEHLAREHFRGAGRGCGGGNLTGGKVFLAVVLGLLCYHLLIAPVVVVIHTVGAVAIVGGTVARIVSALGGSPSPAPRSPSVPSGATGAPKSTPLLR